MERRSFSRRIRNARSAHTLAQKLSCARLVGVGARRRVVEEGWRGGGSRAAVGLTRCGRHWASGRRGDAVSARKHARFASTRAPSVFETRHEGRERVVRDFCRIVFCNHAHHPVLPETPILHPRALESCM